MTTEEKLKVRLSFLARVVAKESRHLIETDQRLFDAGFSIKTVERLDSEPLLGERVEAFVSRFGRLQDTLGDKLLPALFNALGERALAVVDRLDRAERLGLISSSDDWLTMCNLRNQMVHEYVEDSVLLDNALQAAHSFVPKLVFASERMIAELEQRGWLASGTNCS